MISELLDYDFLCQVKALFHFIDVPVEQLLLSKPCKQEPISDEDFIGSTSDEEDINITWYSSESVLDNWREGEDATGISNENVYTSIYPFVYQSQTTLLFTSVHFMVPAKYPAICKKLTFSFQLECSLTYFQFLPQKHGWKHFKPMSSCTLKCQINGGSQ